MDSTFLRGALPISVVVGGTTISASVPQCYFDTHMHSGDAFWGVRQPFHAYIVHIWAQKDE